MTDKVIKIGNVELYESEALKLATAEKKNYIVTYSKIYSLNTYSAKDGCGLSVKGRAIYSSKGMTKRGRFHIMNAESVNKLVGFPLLNID